MYTSKWNVHFKKAVYHVTPTYSNLDKANWIGNLDLVVAEDQRGIREA